VFVYAEGKCLATAVRIAKASRITATTSLTILTTTDMTEQEQNIITLAEKVMGWKHRAAMKGDAFPDAIWYRDQESGRCWLTFWNDTIHIRQLEGWNPYDSIADAWMLVDALRIQQIEVHIGVFAENSCVELSRWRDRRGDGIAGDPHTGRSRETFVLETGPDVCGSICAAALRATPFKATA
jgi:hypothetical protein